MRPPRPRSPRLAQALKEEGAIRLLAAEALGRIGPPATDAVPDLTPVLDAPDLQTRARAAVALWEVGRDAGIGGPACSSKPSVPRTFGTGPREPPRSDHDHHVLPVGFGGLRRVRRRSRPDADPRPRASFRREIVETLGRMKSSARDGRPRAQGRREGGRPRDSARRPSRRLKAIDPDGTPVAEAP